MKLSWIVALFVAGVSLATEPKDTVESEQAKLQGEWKVVKAASSEGGEAPAKELEEMYVIFKGDEYKSDEGRSFHKLWLDVGSKPFKIDLGDSKGIYRFTDRDTLEIYWTKNKLARPKEFAAPKGSHTVIFILKRAKTK